MSKLLDLERRVTALEKAQLETVETQTWMAETLGRIAAVQDNHTRRLDGLETKVGDLRSEFNGLRGEFNGLRGEFNGLRSDFDGLRSELNEFRRDFPSVVADVMRDVLKERR